jgi:hypothetical protein
VREREREGLLPWIPHPFDTGCLPLGDCSNPGVNWRISQGCERETLGAGDKEAIKAANRKLLQEQGEADLARKKAARYVTHYRCTTTVCHTMHTECAYSR